MQKKTKKVVESAEPKQPTAQDFLEKYKKLCKETGFQIVVNPLWKLRDDGSYSMLIQSTVGPLRR